MPWPNRNALRPARSNRFLGSNWSTLASSQRGFLRLWRFRDFGGPTASVPPAGGPFWRDSKLAKVEAVLFLVREPLSTRKIAQLANLADGTEARTLIRRLKALYDASQSAFQVEELAGGYQLFTRSALSPWLRRLLETAKGPRLSAPAMETLAVVAYRQPVLRVDIEAIRGVQCDDILRQLLDRDLVRIIGRSEDLGRPLLYGTTKRFMELFGLKNLEELPRAAAVRSANETNPSPGSEPMAENQSDGNPGNGRAGNDITTDSIPEEKAVTTRIRHAKQQEQELAEPLAFVSNSARLLAASKPLSAAKDEDEEEDEVDDDEEDDDEDDWEDDDDDDEEEDDEDDDFVEEEWEEVDDDEEDDDDEEEDEDDEEWDDEEDDDWEDDDDEEDEDEKWEEDEK
jgi:segregation and condensation protein B